MSRFWAAAWLGSILEHTIPCWKLRCSSRPSSAAKDLRSPARKRSPTATVTSPRNNWRSLASVSRMATANTSYNCSTSGYSNPPMKALPTTLAGVLLLEPQVFGDDRGFFLESYNRRKFAELGIQEEFVQDNHSFSIRNTLRGLHYQV